MSVDRDYEGIPEPVLDWLEWASHELQIGRFERLRLSPLICKRPIDEIVVRRQGLFRDLVTHDVPHGLYLKFRTWVRPSRAYPRGRVIEGDFNVLRISDELAVVASGLSRDEHLHGPDVLWTRSYPLGVSPFVKSLALKHSVENAVAATGLEATCVDATGYCTETRAYRRDTKRQSVAGAFAEMAQQNRNLHSVEVILSDGAEVPRARFSVDREAQVVVRNGNPAMPLARLVLPMSDGYVQQVKGLSVQRAEIPAAQKAIAVTFPEDTFSGNEDLESLCDAIRYGQGLGVTVVHLNPYLLAQVVDYWSGATVGVMVTESNRMVMVPKRGLPDAAMARICATVFEYFGEGEAAVDVLRRGARVS